MKTFLRILVLPLMMLAYGCDSAPKRFDDPTMSVDARVGHDFMLVLPSNPTTGYSWQMTTVLNNTSPVQLVNHEYRRDEPTLAGSGGAEVWKFHGVSVGSTKIAFQYVRPWETNTPPVKTTEFKVDVLP